MAVASSTAVVYSGGGRRYLTLKAACTAEARALLKTRCECEVIDHESHGMEYLTCWYHEDERNAVLMRRLTGGYMRRFRAERKEPKPDVHDCATTRMHEAPKKAITTMPGGYIA